MVRSPRSSPCSSLARLAFGWFLLALTCFPSSLAAGVGGKLLGKGVSKLITRGATSSVSRTVSRSGGRRLGGAVASQVLGKGATQGGERAATRILTRTSRTLVKPPTVTKVVAGGGTGTRVATSSRTVASRGGGGTPGGHGLLGQGSAGGEFPRGHWEGVFARQGITPRSNPVLFDRLMRGRRAAWAKQQAALARSTGVGTSTMVRVGSGPVPAPKSLAAFPDAVRVRPRTSVQGGGGLRKRWKGKKGKIYEWDSQHGTVEVYNKTGKHLGEFHPTTGKRLKPADPTRSVDT